MKGKLLILLYLMFLDQAYGQFSQLWSDTYQECALPSYSNESRKSITDDSGNTYVLMDATSDLDPSGNVTGSTYHYTLLQKFDNTGVMINFRRINIINHLISGFDNKGAFGLVKDSLGYIYIGYTNFNATTNYNVNISKYDSNLIRLWNRSFNTADPDFGVDLKVTGDGIAFAAVGSQTASGVQYHIVKADSGLVSPIPFCSFDTDIDGISKIAVNASHQVFVSGYRTISGYKTIMAAKVDDAGTIKWKTVYNGGNTSRDDYANDISIGVDGNIYVVGTSDRGTAQGNDLAVVKFLATNGKRLWFTFMHTDSTDIGYFIFTPNLNFLYTGSISSNSVIIDRFETLTGRTAGRVVYNPQTVEPAMSFLGLSLTDMKCSSNSNFYVTGNISAIDMAGQEFSAAYLARFKSNHGPRNGLRFEYEVPAIGKYINNYTASAISLDENNDKLIWLRSNFYDFDTHIYEGVTISAYDQVLPMRNGSGNNLSFEQQKFNIENSIYPNPCNDFMNLRDHGNVEKISITDIAGKTILSFQNQINFPVDISTLSPGTYLVELTDTTGHLSIQKMIKSTR